METFKHFAAAMLSPLLIALFLQAIGWILWWRNSRHGIRLIALGTVVLTVGSLAGLTYEQRRAMEHRYSPLEIGDALKQDSVLVAVLGTGFNADPDLPANSQVSGTFHSRLLESVRIYRNVPESRLLVSIAGDADSQAKQNFMTQIIALLNLDPARIDIITAAKSTSDEADTVAKLQNGEKIIIVTSASHMPRAMQIFQDQNLNPIAAPAEFWFPRSGSANDKLWPRWIPSTDGIGSNHQWLYEQIASLWHWVSGK